MKNQKWLVGSFVHSALIFLFAFVAVADEGTVTTLRLPSPELETLPNGLRVAWFVDPKLPIVDLGLLFERGTSSDPVGKSGLALLTGQSLERGAAGKSALEFARAFERLGGSFGVNVDEDGTSISMHGLSRDIDPYFDLLADVALRPNFEATELKQVQDQEADRWSHLGDSVDGLASFAFARWMTAGSPYARGNLESVPEWRKLTREDVVTNYEKNFSPERAILMIVGRVDRASFRKRVLEKFSGWAAKGPVSSASATALMNAVNASNNGTKAKKATVKVTPSRWKAPRAKILIVDRPGLPQAQVRFGFPIPSIYSKNRYALTVGNALLGEYFNSRLNSVIRDELGLAYGIGSSLNYAKELSYLSISSATAIQHVPVLIREVNRILANFRAGQISSAEVVTAKEYLIGGYPMSVATLGAVAGRWLAGVVYGLGPDFLNEYIPKVSAVDQSAVVAAVKEAFRTDQVRVVVAGDAKLIRPLLKKFKFTSVEVQGPRDLLKY